jgi:hypothetical protein
MADALQLTRGFKSKDGKSARASQLLLEEQLLIDELRAELAALGASQDDLSSAHTVEQVRCVTV